MFDLAHAAVHLSSILPTDVSNKQSRRGYVAVGKVPVMLVIAAGETSSAHHGDTHILSLDSSFFSFILSYS